MKNRRPRRKRSGLYTLFLRGLCDLLFNFSAANGTTVIGEYNRLLEDDAYTYTYDNEGNLTRKDAKSDGSYFLYTWDHRNRLSSAERRDAAGVILKRVDYRYDAADQLVTRLEGYYASGNLTTVHEHHNTYADGQVALVLHDNGLNHRRYLWGPGGLVSDERASGITGEFYGMYWAANDHLGTVGQLLNEQAGIAEHREYDSFGAIDAVYSSLGGTRPASLMFSQVAHAGRFWDDQADLYFNHARWYDPHAGRFVGEDPTSFADGPNPFEYAGNDPVNFRDPTGLSQAGNPLNGLFNSTLGGSALLGPQYRAPASNYSRDLASPLGPVNSSYTAAPTFNPTSVANNRLVVQAQREVDLASQRTASLRSQLSAAKQTLLNRSFYEVFDKRSDRALIASLRSQLSEAQGRRSIAYDNLNSAQDYLLGDGPLQTFTYDTNGTRYVSVGDQLRDSGGYLSGVGQVAKGYGDAAVNTAQGVYNVARHPINTVQGVATAVRHPILTGQAIYNDLAEKSQTLRGQGNIVGDVLTGIATGGTLKAAKEAGLVGKITSKLRIPLNSVEKVAPENLLRQRVLANIAESQAARQSSGFAVHRAIEGIYENARIAVQAARNAGLTNQFGRLGTRAHQVFASLNRTFNNALEGSGVQLVVEQFRNAAGGIVKPHASGSRALDVFVNVAGQAYRGFDLKTAGTWTKGSLADIQSRFKVPVTQVQR